MYGESICPECSDAFTKMRPNQQYCSAEHQKKYNLRRWHENNKAHVTSYRKNTAEKRNAIRRQKYAECEDTRTAAREQVKRWRSDNPKKRKAQRLRQYGLTIAEFNKLLESQGHKCAICGYDDKSDPNIFFFFFHCHTTGKVRGLLCASCNHGLGKFKDSQELLIAAAEYLK